MKASPELPRPRLILFRFRYEESVPTFLRIHQDEQVRCLRQFFDVHVISNNCDYDRVCDAIEPDLAVFESGLETARTHRLDITNTNAHSSVPKVALLNADGCSELRSAILSDLDQWQIDTAFSISAVAPEHFEGLIPNLFVWPNFIDPHSFCDRGLPKLVPVLLSGSQSPRYPWRRNVFPQLLESCCVLVCPHPGYTAHSRIGLAIIGDDYARSLNTARVVPTCGSISRELVRKHLEIPAARSCLITENTPTVQAAGFVDMVNCVFADASDVLDKVEYLLSNTDRLSEITDSGYQLVHSRHTLEQRGHLLEWLQLKRSAGREQRILQSDPFAPLTLATDEESDDVPIFRSGSLHLAELSAARTHMRAHRYHQARKGFQNCRDWLVEFPEARFGLVVCELIDGNAHEALSLLAANIKQSLRRYRAQNPDPIEWAFLILCLLCLGRKRAAFKRALQFPQLRHSELDCVRALVEATVGSSLAIGNPTKPCGFRSIHSTPWRTEYERQETIIRMLEKSGQRGIADHARRHLLDPDHHASDPSLRSSVGRQLRLASYWRPWKTRVSLSRWDHPDLSYAVFSKVAARFRRFFSNNT